MVNNDVIEHLWALELECEAFMKMLQERLAMFEDPAIGPHDPGYVRAFSEVMFVLQKDFPTLSAMIRGGVLD